MNISTLLYKFNQSSNSLTPQKIKIVFVFLIEEVHYYRSLCINDSRNSSQKKT
jgi:hypothetical protein